MLKIPTSGISAFFLFFLLMASCGEKVKEQEKAIIVQKIDENSKVSQITIQRTDSEHPLEKRWFNEDEKLKMIESFEKKPPTVTEYKYDSRGKLFSLTESELETQMPIFQTLFFPDVKEERRFEDSMLVEKTITRYDSLDNIISREKQNGDGKPLYFEEFVYENGRLTEEKMFHPNGALIGKQNHIYRGKYRINSYQYENGLRLKGMVHYAYNVSGQLLSETQQNRFGAVIQRQDFIFDNKGRLIQTLLSERCESGVCRKLTDTKTEFDANGRVVKEIIKITPDDEVIEKVWSYTFWDD